MPGIWKIECKPEATTVSYFDRTTRKSWDCGDMPPGVPLLSTLDWVCSRISAADEIQIDGTQYVCDFGNHIFNSHIQ